MLFLLVRTIALRRVCYFWSGLLSVRKRNSCSRPTTMSLGSSVSSAVTREEEMVNNCMVVIVDINVGNRQRRIKAVEGQKAPLNIDDICMYSHKITYRMYLRISFLKQSFFMFHVDATQCRSAPGNCRTILYVSTEILRGM